MMPASPGDDEKPRHPNKDAEAVGAKNFSPLLMMPRPFHGGIVRRGNLGVRGRENIPKVTV